MSVVGMGLSTAERATGEAGLLVVKPGMLAARTFAASRLEPSSRNAHRAGPTEIGSDSATIDPSRIRGGEISPGPSGGMHRSP